MPGSMKRAYGLIAATLLIVLGGCNPQPPGIPGVAYQATLPGGPLGNIPRAELRSLGKSVAWVGCDTTARTGWLGGTTDVEICAAQYAKDVGRGYTNRKGVLVARMVNLGTGVDRRWGLTPKDTSFIAGFPAGRAQGAYAILEVPRNSYPGTTIRVLVEGGSFTYCPHTWQPAASSAEFETCDGKLRSASHQRGANEIASGPQASADAPLQSADGPAWVSCRSGCCTTELQ